MKNKSIIVLMCILIIMIIVTIYLATYKKPNKSKVEYTFETVEENTIITDNSYDLFSKYKNGCVSSKEYYETISNFYKQTIPNYHNKLEGKSKNQVLEYYNSNKQNIENDITIQSENEFIKFSEMLADLKKGDLVLEKLNIQNNTVVSNTDFVSAQINIKYIGNDSICMGIKVYRNQQQNGKNIEFYMIK